MLKLNALDTCTAVLMAFNMEGELPADTSVCVCVGGGGGGTLH